MKIIYCEKDAAEAVEKINFDREILMDEIPLTTDELVNMLPFIYEDDKDKHLHKGIKVVFEPMEAEDEVLALFYVPARIPADEEDMSLMEITYDQDKAVAALELDKLEVGGTLH